MLLEFAAQLTAGVLLAFSARRAVLLAAASLPSPAPDPALPDEQLPTVEVLVPCHNEAASLPALFRGLDILSSEYTPVGKSCADRWIETIRHADKSRTVDRSRGRDHAHFESRDRRYSVKSGPWWIGGTYRAIDQRVTWIPKDAVVIGLADPFRE